MRVLVVEDEVRLANNIAEALRERCGFAVDCAGNGTDGASMTEFKHYDLLLLDLMLPGLDGLSIVRQVRRRKDMTPILILTARDQRAWNLTGCNKQCSHPAANVEKHNY